MKRLTSILNFFTLSDFSSATYFENLVIRHHQKWSDRYENWSYESTKHKLLSAYWTRIVPLHFLALLGLVVVVFCLVISGQQTPSSLLTVIFVTSILIYVILRIWVYNPLYLTEYIPLLSHTIEKLSGDQTREQDEIKKRQYKAITIVLIQIVVNKLTGLSNPTGGKNTKDQMAKLYGISERSFHDALNTVLKADWKPSARMDAEMASAFRDAGQYFRESGNAEAVNLLSQIQTDLLIAKKPPVL